MAGRIAVRRSALLRICILMAAAMAALLAIGPAAASASVSTPEGPVAAWSFDEGEGTIAHDATGRQDGTVEGALWSTGKFGGGLRFEEGGEQQCVYVPDSEALDFEGGEMTLEAWVKPEHWLGSAPILFKEAEPGHGQSYTFGIGMTE